MRVRNREKCCRGESKEGAIFIARYRLTFALAVRTARGSARLTGQGSSSACAVCGGGCGDAAPPTRAPRASWRARDVGRNRHIQATSCCYRVVLAPQYPGYCGWERVDARQTSGTKQYETSFAAGRARPSDKTGAQRLDSSLRVDFLSLASAIGRTTRPVSKFGPREVPKRHLVTS